MLSAAIGETCICHRYPELNDWLAHKVHNNILHVYISGAAEGYRNGQFCE